MNFRNGDTISYTYTPLGYLTSVSSSKDNTSISYSYDNLGNRTSMTDDTGTTSYKYNIFNQLVNETKGSIVKDYTYDLNGNQLSFKITDNGKVTLNESYAYDKINQVSSITAADVTANFTYDNNGNMLTYKRNSITTAYTYNTANMPVSVKTSKGTSYENDTITYYLNGNKKTTKDINNNTTTYEYDGMGRLSSEQETNGYSAVYSYDNYGNRIGKTVNEGDNSHNICYTYDKNNQLLTETKDVQGGQEINRYFYDANGNQTYRNEEKITLSTQKDYSVKLNSGGHGTSYEYDGLNRLVRADDGTNVSAYTYDGNNLRQSKTVNGVTTRHIYNGMNVVQEKEANSLKATYHRAGNQIICSEVQGNKNFYIYNAQGNVSKLLNAAGETVADYTFDAFGVQKAVSGEVYNPFRHNGEYYDDELGYTYLRNRYYDNNIGRFITEDPVKDGLNWYSYCGNNPINYIDPTGLDIYYFVSSEFVKEAQKGKDGLEKQYGEPVHILEVSSKNEFVTEWNMMGSWAGENVDVSLVIINMHGEPESISVNKDGSDPIYASDLKPKNLGGIVLLNCNTGHLDHKYNTFAKWMLVRNNVEYVIAADGGVSADRGGFGIVKANKFSTYSWGNFYNYNWVHPDPRIGQYYRDAQGFIKYTKNSIGELEWEFLGKNLDLTDL